MLDRIAEGRSVDPNFSKNFKIKRMGKDKDDLFWSFGKVHGLENIAFADSQELAATQGDPWRLQQLVNKINDSEKPLPAQSFDKLVEGINDQMNSYRSDIDSNANGLTYNPSDRKKLLGLPFLMSKRSEVPEPKKGQKEWDIFYAMFDLEWNHFEGVLFDSEEKITEFNYENYIPKHILNSVDTHSDEFKTMVKQMNFNTNTQFEQHKQN